MKFCGGKSGVLLSLSFHFLPNLKNFPGHMQITLEQAGKEAQFTQISRSQNLDFSLMNLLLRPPVWAVAYIYPLIFTLPHSPALPLEELTSPTFILQMKENSSKEMIPLGPVPKGMAQGAPRNDQWGWLTLGQVPPTQSSGKSGSLESPACW